MCPPLKINMSPEKGTTQKENGLPTIIFRGKTDRHVSDRTFWIKDWHVSLMTEAARLGSDARL